MGITKIPRDALPELSLSGGEQSGLSPRGSPFCLVAYSDGSSITAGVVAAGSPPQTITN